MARKAAMSFVVLGNRFAFYSCAVLKTTVCGLLGGRGPLPSTGKAWSKAAVGL
jgi:hypothetical protein